MPKYLYEDGFTKALKLNPEVSPANPSYSASVSVGRYQIEYSAKVDEGSKLTIDLPSGDVKWGIYEDFKDKLTSTKGIERKLADAFGILGEKAQNYLSEKGFGEITVGTGSVSFDPKTLKLKLKTFKIEEEKYVKYIPYRDAYKTTIGVEASTDIDLSKPLAAALAIIIAIGLFYMLQTVGVAAVANVMTTLGVAGINRLAQSF